VGDVLAVIRDLKSQGMTMVIATHEMAFAREVADEVCFLHDGLIAERGPAERVLTDPQRAETQRFLRRILETQRL
jgi:polar amino acid transport system ATP-binding protein